MPLFQIGYRRYEGERTSHAMRWRPITRTGVAIALRSKLLKRLIFVSFLPFLYFGWVFFVIGRLTDPGTDPQASFYELAREVFGAPLVNQLHEDPTVIRSAVWAMVFASFVAFFQMLMTGFVAAVAGPPLVANDLRSRAFLIYFARPVSRLDYVIGKTGVLVTILAAVSLLPAMILYLLSILFSPSLDTVAQTLPVAGSIVLACLGMIIPASLLILTLSALTRQPRFATVAWFAICIFGPLAHEILQQTRGLRGSSWTFLLSFPHTVRTLQLGLFDVAGRVEEVAFPGELHPMVEVLTTRESPAMAAAWLALLSAGCLFLLLRRVDAPTRI